MWFSFALVILGAVMDNFSQLQGIIAPQYYGAIIIAIGVIVAALRFVTTQGVEQ